MESFFGTLKAECVDQHDFQTPAEATTILFCVPGDLLQPTTPARGAGLSPAASDAKMRAAERMAAALTVRQR